MDSPNVSELKRIPSEFKSIYNRLSAVQSIINGEKSFNIPDKEIETNKEKLNKDKNYITQSKEKQESLNQKQITLNNNISENQLETILVKCFSNIINKQNIIIKESSNSLYEAELKINVLTHKFFYKYSYKYTNLLIFVLTEPFSLTIKEPVQFDIYYEGIEQKNALCIGNPLSLPDLGISLLLFAI